MRQSRGSQILRGRQTRERWFGPLIASSPFSLFGAETINGEAPPRKSENQEVEIVQKYAQNTLRHREAEIERRRGRKSAKQLSTRIHALQMCDSTSFVTRCNERGRAGICLYAPLPPPPSVTHAYKYRRKTTQQHAGRIYVYSRCSAAFDANAALATACVDFSIPAPHTGPQQRRRLAAQAVCRGGRQGDAYARGSVPKRGGGRKTLR